MWAVQCGRKGLTGHVGVVYGSSRDRGCSTVSMGWCGVKTRWRVDEKVEDSKRRAVRTYESIKRDGVDELLGVVCSM